MGIQPNWVTVYSCSKHSQWDRGVEMKKLTCEVCGGQNLMKNGDTFECQDCGCLYSLADVRGMMSAGAGTSHSMTSAREEAKEDFSAMLDNIERLFTDKKYGECYAACAEILKKDPRNPLALIFTALTDKAGHAVSNTDWSYLGMILALGTPLGEFANRTGENVDVYYSTCMRILRYIAEFEREYRSACRTKSQIEFNNTVLLAADFRSNHTREIELKKYEIERLKRESTAEIVSECAETVVRMNKRLTAEQIRKIASRYSFPSAQKYIDEAVKRDAEAARQKREAERRLREEEERRRREAEENRRKQRALATSAWWEEHPDEKAALEAQIEELTMQVEEADQECDELRKKRQAAVIERDDKSDSEAELERIQAQLVQLKRTLSNAQSTRISRTVPEAQLSTAKTILTTKRTKLDQLVAEKVSVNEASLSSLKRSDSLVAEIDKLEQELASLGVFAFGKKRTLKDLVEQKRAELEVAERQVEEERSDRLTQLEQERQTSIAELQQEIASLEAEIEELEPIAAEAHAAAAAKTIQEVDEAKAKISELEPIAEQMVKQVEAEREARRDRLGSVIHDLDKAFSVAQRKKEALQRDLMKAKSALSSPDLPKEFLATFADA